jgi:hypothetical protein
LDQRRERGEVNSPLKDRRGQEEGNHSGKVVVDASAKKKKGTYFRKPRQDREPQGVDPSLLPSSNSKKRGTKQVWMQVPVRVVGKGSSESAEKRRRTATVFDRLDDGVAVQNSVFDRLEDPSADPGRQGRWEQ